jgi:hypothetical protein
MHHIKLTQS